MKLGPIEISNPVLAAPMAGGPTTPAMVVAADEVGSIGFLAGGYKDAEELRSQINVVRTKTELFGVNLFAPNAVPVDLASYSRYADEIQPEADIYGIDLGAIPATEDDDNWTEKIALLLEAPVPIVSFTFGLPDSHVITSLHRVGTFVLQTVTSADEARLAVDADVDGLAVQGWEAGGHSATFTPAYLPKQVGLVELVGQVRSAVSVPLVAAGGLTSSDQIRNVLAAGATAVAVGTLLLRTTESGASAAYKQALANRAEARTLLTRAFSGRPARAIPNLFTDRYDQLAPSGYPAINHLTSGLRRAAAQAGDAERINLWAGTGHRLAREESVTDTLDRLAAPL